MLFREGPPSFVSGLFYVLIEKYDFNIYHSSDKSFVFINIAKFICLIIYY